MAKLPLLYAWLGIDINSQNPNSRYYRRSAISIAMQLRPSSTFFMTSQIESVVFRGLERRFALVA